MTNYEHYLTVAEQIYPEVLRKLTTPWRIEYRDILPEQNQKGCLDVNFVAEDDTVFHRVKISADQVEMWPDKQPVNVALIEYIIRGAARMAPLRQAAYRKNLAYWLENCLQVVHSVVSCKAELQQAVSDNAYPYPSKVKLNGDYLPCWVLCEKEQQLVVSVIDSRTGHFGLTQNVDASQLVDSERWFEAQVIDSAEEAIDTAMEHVKDLVRSTDKHDDNEPKLLDAVKHPSASTLSPVVSVMLMMGIVVAFFVIFKIQLGF
ncbi:hypothetical protein [Photobacterium lipolyticum]|uniref:Uncharacterized protein n=1 Tax=Photobacterium lipolyticum TaxID=266810 RepID=A0A2T3MWN7_9GAMM|nr:hypothetical protein [Photobacterium lipolyticum]PSW04353.1 hypothetical protein C9I89_13590 [Photobacterium lipolyticum]